MSAQPDDTGPSAEALDAAHTLLRQLLGDNPHPNDALSTALALDRFRAAGTREDRPVDRITQGLRGALLVSSLAGEIIDILPPDVASRDLFHQIMALLAPHVSGETP